MKNEAISAKKERGVQEKSIANKFTRDKNG